MHLNNKTIHFEYETIQQHTARCIALEPILKTRHPHRSRAGMPCTLIQAGRTLPAAASHAGPKHVLTERTISFLRWLLIDFNQVMGPGGSQSLLIEFIPISNLVPLHT